MRAIMYRVRFTTNRGWYLFEYAAGLLLAGTLLRRFGPYSTDREALKALSLIRGNLPSLRIASRQSQDLKG